MRSWLSAPGHGVWNVPVTHTGLRADVVLRQIDAAAGRLAVGVGPSQDVRALDAATIPRGRPLGGRGIHANYLSRQKP